MNESPLPLPAVLPLLERLAVFTERRHEVLAGNVANISTPGYRPRDLPVEAFQAALRRALQPTPADRAAPALGASPTEAASLAEALGTALGEAQASPFDRDLLRARERPGPETRFHDGAERNLERELLELTKNSIRQSLAMDLLVSQYNQLQMVIGERV